MAFKAKILAPLGALLRRTSYLRKWLVLGAIIGVVAGLAAILFMTGLHLATKFFLGVLGGYTPPSPAGEGNSFGSGAHFVRPWAIPLIVGLGGLLSGILVFALAPEAEGHGTDAAIAAVHHNPRGIRARVWLVKMVASAITIGAGGSGGREGPTAQISAGFGSMLARWLDLTPDDARIAVAVGIGSGIGSIFRAPLGGAVLGAEILYRDDVEVEALVPSLVASIVGFAIFGAVEGFSPIFGFLRGYRFDHPLELVYYAGIGIAGGLVGRLYAWSFYHTASLTKRLPGSRMLKPAAAGVLVGLVGLALPGALGTGYGWVQQAMEFRVLSLPLWVVLALPFAKILATSLSIGSGGSGGIFGPGMVIGGFLGAGVWRLAQHLPAVPHDPAPFVIVGMIACFGSIAHAPLAVMLMVAEMTGSLELLAPAMVAMGLAVLVVGDATIYASQLKHRAESPAHRFRFAMPLLASLPVTEAMRLPRAVVETDTPAGVALDRLRALGLSGAPVCDDRGRFKGSVDVDRLAAAAAEDPVARLASASAPTVTDDVVLAVVVQSLAARGVSWITVLDRERHVVGVVATSDLVRAYRRSLAANLRRLESAFAGTRLLEERVCEESAIAGTSPEWRGWPPGAIALAIQRGEQFIFPRGNTVFEVGDVVSLLVPADREPILRALFQSPPTPDRSSESAGPDPV